MGWGIRQGYHRIVLVCADNLDVFRWLESGKIKTGTTCGILKRLHTRCVERGVQIIPRYIRSGNNLSADGLTRWSGRV